MFAWLLLNTLLLCGCALVAVLLLLLLLLPLLQLPAGQPRHC
jgi:hypothetical protein